MTAPLEITFRSMEPSPAVEQTIRTWMRRLEHSCDDILRCAVVIEVPHRRHRRGNSFRVHIEVAVPDRTISVSRDLGVDHRGVQAPLADAFRATRRALQDYVRVRRGDVKTHAA